MNETTTPAVRVIRDKEFAKRLIQAVEDHAHAPSGHGRQKWVRDKLLAQFGVDVSAEALRKWFSGEARPRPKTMKLIANIVDVDEAWLSLGLTPDEAPHEARKRNANADGAVNYIAGLIQMAGGVIAFPDFRQDDPAPDVFAILGAKHISLEVRRGALGAGHAIRFNLSTSTKGRVVLGVIDSLDDETSFKIIRLPQDVIERHGQRRGGFVEVAVKGSGIEFRVEGEPLAVVTQFRSLIDQPGA